MPKPTQHIVAIFCNRGSLMVASVYVVKSYIIMCDDESGTAESAPVCRFHHALPLQKRVTTLSTREHSDFWLPRDQKIGYWIDNTAVVRQCLKQEVLADWWYSSLTPKTLQADHYKLHLLWASTMITTGKRNQYPKFWSGLVLIRQTRH
jgi:hypothetical protein